MSRSTREPWYKDGYKGSRRKQFYKNQANRAVRNFEGEIPNGKWYRKLHDTWDICDYSYRFDPHPYVRINWRTNEAEWVYPCDGKVWQVFRK